MNCVYNFFMEQKTAKARPRQGEHLMKLRVEAGLSQRELARLIGEPQQNITYWEHSEKPPRSDVLPKIAKLLNVGVEDLLRTDQVIQRRGGPVGRLQLVFEEVSELPRRQQEKIIEFVTAYVSHYKQERQGEKTCG